MLTFYLINWYNDRLSMINALISLALNGYIMSILKLLYSDPRPYMSSPDIKLYECSVENGNPSGHSFLSAYFFLLFLWLLDKNVFNFLKEKNYKKLIFLLFLFFWIFLVAFSRVFLGVHSLNQVLLGIVYGVFNFILYS